MRFFGQERYRTPRSLLSARAFDSRLLVLSSWAAHCVFV